MLQARTCVPGPEPLATLREVGDKCPENEEGQSFQRGRRAGSAEGGRRRQIAEALEEDPAASLPHMTELRLQQGHRTPRHLRSRRPHRRGGLVAGLGIDGRGLRRHRCQVASRQGLVEKGFTTAQRKATFVLLGRLHEPEAVLPGEPRERQALGRSRATAWQWRGRGRRRRKQPPRSPLEVLDLEADAQRPRGGVERAAHHAVDSTDASAPLQGIVDEMHLCLVPELDLHHAVR
mmetsp:Transcript_75172/g.244425  ORF Transcript_75172/g.244425 Transcript_75172/m.244425 type:complete len:234 (-) Transcript_75172:459-1160(-)